MQAVSTIPPRGSRRGHCLCLSKGQGGRRGSHQHRGVEPLAEALHHRQHQLGEQLLAGLGIIHPVHTVKLKRVLGLNAGALSLLGQLNL